MKYLFIHQNFPGQFIYLSQHLASDPGNRVVALSIHKLPVPKGVDLRCYTMLRPAVPETHPMLQDMEAKVLRAEACASAAWKLKQEGFEPDIIIAHPGWGETLFIKDVFPHAKIVMYCEYYYAAEGQDVGFDPEIPAMNFPARCRLRLKNTINLHALQIADAAISPTQWQRSTFPDWAQQKINVIHDGINLEFLQPDLNAKIQLARQGLSQEFTHGAEILTYIARNLEAVRGFHIFMRSLPKVLRQRPNARVVIVGGDDVSYGGKAPGNLSWKEYMLNELKGQLDLSRIHFVGKVPYSTYLNLLQISKVHVYWTTPFVLSWSFLETALSGAPLLASNTQPVQEFAAELGVQTIDFFDVDGWSEQIIARLASKSEKRSPRRLERIELANCLPAHLKLLHSL